MNLIGKLIITKRIIRKPVNDITSIESKKTINAINTLEAQVDNQQVL